MKKIPADRKYMECHLWFVPDPDDSELGTVGVTDDFQAKLGDFVSVELPRTGASLGPDDMLVCLEGMLEAAEIAAPTQLKVEEVNPRLEIHPTVANRDCYGNGWLAKVRVLGVPRLMEAPVYAQFLATGIINEGA